MSLRSGTPNPLNYFELRRVDFAAPQFAYTTIPKYTTRLMADLGYWITQNLNSRFYLGRVLLLDHTRTIIYGIRIGFESEKELSYFTIVCPHL